jgi:Uma2 family endonuclease
MRKFMEPQIEHKTWTDEELMNLPDREGKYEPVDGELTVVGTGFLHEVLIVRLAVFLQLFAHTHDLGLVGAEGLGCRMKDGNLRCPDFSFVTKAWASNMGKNIVGFLQGAHDLAVEIASPSDSPYNLKRKAVEYFENGCRLCRIVEPCLKTVLVMVPDGLETFLTSRDSLDGGALLPGFAFPVLG